MFVLFGLVVHRPIVVVPVYAIFVLSCCFVVPVLVSDVLSYEST